MDPARAASCLPCAQTATVLFGQRVHALTWPGQAPAQVTGFGASDRTERACLAIDALDGALGLSRPGTARLHRAGCGVVILTPAGYAAHCEFTGCQITETDNPAGAIDAISRALTT